MRRFAFVLVLVPFLTACEPPEHIVDARLVRDGVELHVAGPQGIETSDVFITRAAQRWNEGCGVELFYWPTPTPDVTAGVGYVPTDWEGWDDTADADGIAAITFSRLDGLIFECAVTVSSDIAYHTQTAEDAAAHELGHCLGLADCTPSLDHPTIMGDPVPFEGEVLERACELATEFFE